MHRSRVLAEKGRDGNMNEMLEWYKEQDAAVYDPAAARAEDATPIAKRPKQLSAKRRTAIDDLTAIDRHPDAQRQVAR